MKLNQIKDTGAIRDHGKIEGLKTSIKEVGLINPITVDKKNKLLAGRRRFQAVKEMGWKEVPVRVLDTKDDLEGFRITIDENLKRKNLTEPEVAMQIDDYHKLNVELEGKPKTKGHRTDLKGKPRLLNNPGWKQEDTAKALGISQASVQKAIVVASAITANPSLAKINDKIRDGVK